MNNLTFIFHIKVDVNHRNGQFKDLICFEYVFLICYSKGWYKVCCVYKHIVIYFISNSDLLLTEVRATSKYQRGHSYKKDPFDHKGLTPTYCNLSVPKCSPYPWMPLTLVNFPEVGHLCVLWGEFIRWQLLQTQNQCFYLCISHT